LAVSQHLIESLRGRPARGALALILLAAVAAGCGGREAVEPREVPWRLVSQDGRALQLEVQAGGPPCDAILDVDVDEQPDAVTVTVRAGSEPDAECGPGVAAVLGTFPVTARLREPLGDRTLRDGAR
jgi:hypothetical protein